MHTDETHSEVLEADTEILGHLNMERLHRERKSPMRHLGSEGKQEKKTKEDGPKKERPRVGMSVVLAMPQTGS